MTAYNKLASALILCFAAQSGYALTFNAAQVESTQGQLLYVEIPYANASDNSSIQASLANPDDLVRMGASQQDLSGLNFFVRRTGNNSGVIVITSSQPISNKNINLILKVQDADGAHLQQIQRNLDGTPSNTATLNKTTPIANLNASTQERVLIPKQVVSEKDIALNLPESTLYTQNSTAPINAVTPASALAISVAPVPVVKSIPPTPTGQTAQVTPQPQATTPQPTQTTSANKTPATAPKKAVESKPVTTAKNTQNGNYVVQRQDSLWSIAARISGQTHQPIGEVMNHIKALNEHAFVGGNVNRLRTGTNLNLGATPPHANSTSAKPAARSTNTSSDKYSTKYRLDQAEMTLVAENTDAASAKMGGSSRTAEKTSSELSLKVMTIRQKTVTLQKNVAQLDLALQQKDHQIQLLNARLAQLQQQLQQQQKAKKPSHH
ncbi:hypothetical protein LVY74_10440 [Acinetobacter sp. ME22]|uniref:type IV pilus assembly protein FimV n=1 Tax=Acinetobacter sp. ME22 TaxID=2904802 RepID=UPI001ED9D065|nr:hypothetical protein [Acinetobacter sp. ME22]MCG2573971.1 hypothetical protein [Acinetobacter sp. ME22]